MTRTVRDLLVGLLIACVCSSSVSEECKGCNIEKECCERDYNSTECNKGFKAEIKSSKDPIKEGDDIILTCSHNIPNLNLSYAWFLNDGEMKDYKNNTVLMKKVLSEKNGKYKCCVKTSCGSCESEAFVIAIENNAILILVICGVSALVLVLVMGVAMKIKLKKDQAQHQERRRQRELERNAQNPGQIPFPRGY